MGRGSGGGGRKAGGGGGAAAAEAQDGGAYRDYSAELGPGADPAELVPAAAAWRAGLDSDEIRAVGEYQALSHKDINDFLRKGEIGPDTDRAQVERAVAGLDSALAGARTSRGLVAYRAVDAAAAIYGPLTGANLVGREFTDRGFTSTTLRRAQAEEYAYSPGHAIVRLRVPAGTRAAYLGGQFSRMMAESELLLGRGSRFRVTRVGVEGGRTVIDADVLHR